MPDTKTLWLWLSLAEGMGPKTANGLWATLCQRGMDLEDFFGLDEHEWAEEFSLNSRVVSGLASEKSRIDEIAEQVQALDENGIRLVPLPSPDYPGALKDSLGRDAPMLLYAQGNHALLERNAVAVVGARDAGARGLILARFIGEALAQRGLVVISGGARGTDTEAVLGALAAEGTIVTVLACGIRRYRPPSALHELATPESALYLSELPLKQTWDTGGAMMRNRIVCGLASAIVIIESQESGGTVHAANKAFELGKPLFVIQFDEYDEHSAGNPQLLRLGARPLKACFDPDDRSWRVDINPVVAAAEKRAIRKLKPHQTDLFSP